LFGAFLAVGFGIVVSAPAFSQEKGSYVVLFRGCIRKKLFLNEARDTVARGWLLDVMRCVERLGKTEFTLQEVYRFENELRRIYPDNKHIREKIRQQLQLLRDKGFLDFVERGLYRLT